MKLTLPAGTRIELPAIETRDGWDHHTTRPFLTLETEAVFWVAESGNMAAIRNMLQSVEDRTRLAPNTAQLSVAIITPGPLRECIKE